MENADQTDWNGTLAVSFSSKKSFPHLSTQIFFPSASIKYRATIESSSGNRGINTSVSEAFRKLSIFLRYWEAEMEDINLSLWFRRGMWSNVSKEKGKQCARSAQNGTAELYVCAVLLQGRGKRYSDVLWESHILNLVGALMLFSSWGTSMPYFGKQKKWPLHRKANYNFLCVPHWSSARAANFG